MAMWKNLTTLLGCCNAFESIRFLWIPWRISDTFPDESCPPAIVTLIDPGAQSLHLKVKALPTANETMLGQENPIHGSMKSMQMVRPPVGKYLPNYQAKRMDTYICATGTKLRWQPAKRYETPALRR